MRRRDFLTAAALSAPMAPWVKALAASEIPSQGPLSAVITLGSTTLTFEEEKGEDLGAYQGVKFVQRCVRATLPDVPLTVFFRPDADSNRVEVVFELGRTFGEANRAAKDWGAYKVTIFRGKTQLAQIDVPFHSWFATWRWQSAPRPVIRTVEELTARHLLLPFDSNSVFNAELMPPVRYRGPMDDAGIARDMPGAGERPDIGPVTDWQAGWIITRRADQLESLLAQGEGAGSVPWNIRDDKTGAPLDFYEHPLASWGNQTEKSLPAYIYHTDVKDTKWDPDSAHQPALAYVPYMLTDDPYYLEKLQFQANWHIGEQLNVRYRFKIPIAFGMQVRALAWAYRSIGQLATTTPEQTPRWLLPRAHWKRVLEDNRHYFEEQYVDDQGPRSKIFHWAVDDVELYPFMDAFLVTSIGWLILMGHTEWRRAFEWKIQSIIAMTNGKSGWARQFPTPYVFWIGPEHVWPAEQKTFYRSWGEAWEVFRKWKYEQNVKQGITPPDFPPNPPPPEPTYFGISNSGSSLFYLVQYRGALAVGAMVGVPEARECAKFMDDMVRDCVSKRHTMGGAMYRWAIPLPA